MTGVIVVGALQSSTANATTLVASSVVRSRNALKLTTSGASGAIFSGLNVADVRSAAPGSVDAIPSSAILNGDGPSSFIGTLMPSLSTTTSGLMVTWHMLPVGIAALSVG